VTVDCEFRIIENYWMKYNKNKQQRLPVGHNWRMGVSRTACYHHRMPFLYRLWKNNTDRRKL